MSALFSRLVSAAPVLLLAVICFSHIHQGTLAVDGVRYGGIAGHIVHTGDWLHLYDARTESLYVNKPPLLFWLLAITFQAFGYSTFIAKFPAVLFGFLGALFYWHTIAKFFGKRVGFFALVSLVGCRFFLHDVIDLAFEGMVLLAGSLLLHGALSFLADREALSRIRPWVYVMLGIFLLAESKMPYLGLVAFPVVISFWQRGLLGDMLKNYRFWLALAPSIAAVAIWFAISHDGYVAGAADNQLVEPFRRADSYLHNLLQWSRSLFITYAPATELALWGLYRTYLRKDVHLKPSKFDSLLLLWLVPIVPIVLTAGCRPRYILIPMLAVTIFAARSLDYLLRRYEPEQFYRLMLGFAIVLMLFCLSGIATLHRADPIILALRQDPALVEQIGAYCVEPSLPDRAREEQTNTAVLLALEFGKAPSDYTVISSGEVLTHSGLLLANRYCREKLTEHLPAPIEVVKSFHRANLISVP